MSFTSRILGSKPEEAKKPAKRKEGQLAVDVYETADDIVIIAPVAGVSLDGIQLSVADDVITIKGERKVPEETEDDSYYSRECFWGPFARSIILPTAVETDSIKASFKDSILKIKVPKTSSVAKKTINITLE
jgi:HSP20 family protein